MAKEKLTPAEELTQLIEIFNYYDGWRSVNFDDLAEECYRLYRGYVDELPEGEERSNLHLPISYELVDTWRSRRLTNFFGNIRPWFDLEPLPDYNTLDIDTLTKRLELGKKYAALIDSQLIKNKIKSLYYRFTTSEFVFPLAIMSVGWRWEEREVRFRRIVKEPLDALGMTETRHVSEPTSEMRVVWDDNELKNVSFYDFWPDPWGGPDIESWRGCFHREYLNRDGLEKLLKHAKKYLTEGQGDGKVYDPDWDELDAAGLDSDSYDRSRLFDSVGIEMESESGYEDLEGSDNEELRMYEVIHYWTKKRHKIMVNRTQIVANIQNPYWHELLPFVVQSFEPIEDCSVGMGLVQITKDIQIEVNTTENQKIDAISMLLNKMFKVMRGADIDYRQLVWKRNGVIEVNNPNDVTEMGISDVPASAFQNEMTLKQWAENAVAVPEIVRGATGQQQTAHEASIKNNNASIRFQVKMEISEDMSIDRMLILMDANNQQYYDDVRLLEMYGEEGAKEWIEVGFEDIRGAWRFSPSSAQLDPSANKEVRREQLINAYQLFRDDPDIHQLKLKKAVLESLDLRDAQTFVKTPEEKEAEMIQQMALTVGGQIQTGQPSQNGSPGAPGASQAGNMIDSMLQTATSPGPLSGIPGGGG